MPIVKNDMMHAIGVLSKKVYASGTSKAIVIKQLNDTYPNFDEEGKVIHQVLPEAVKIQ